MKKILIFFLFLPFIGITQSKDAELWTGIGLKADLGDKFGLKYEGQTRFFKNASVLRQIYNEISLDYELIKNVEFGLSYRFSQKRNDVNFKNENRFSFNLEYGDKIKPINLKVKGRARYQFAYDRFQVINDVIYPDQKSTFRFKLELSYSDKKIKRIEPFAGAEIFKTLYEPSIKNGVDAYRLYAGMDFDLPARHEVGVKYIFEKELGNAPFNGHIYAIEYAYKLSNKLFKKKK